MAKIKPFGAIRPTRDKAALATSRTYDAYSKPELRASLKYNPFSFLHIIKPGFDNNIKLKGEERFELIHKTYQQFKSQDIYRKDSKPMFYLHQKSYGEDVFWGIIGVAHVEDYQNNIIKKHEDTLKEREALFGNYLKVAGFNAEPVLLTYPENDFLNRIYHKYCQTRAEYEFMTQNRRLHKLWLIEDIADIKIVESTFSEMKALYIADGHHRTASSNYLANLMARQNKNHTGEENYNYFMSYLISDANLKISSFNRFIKDLNGLSKEAFLDELSVLYRIENRHKKTYNPSKKHHFTMYLDGEYYSLYLKKSFPINNALSDLDTHILNKTILKPILGIKDLKTDPRIKCLPTVYKKKQLKKEVDSGNYKVGFGLFPVSVDQLKAVVDQDLRMPPKSTYIEPKLRSGLTIFEFFE